MDDDLLAPPKRTVGRRQLYSLDLPPELRVNMDRAFAFVANQQVPSKEKVTLAPWEENPLDSNAQDLTKAASHLGILSDIQARSLVQEEVIRDMQKTIQDPNQILKGTSSQETIPDAWKEEELPEHKSLLKPQTFLHQKINK